MRIDRRLIFSLGLSGAVVGTAFYLWQMKEREFEKRFQTDTVYVLSKYVSGGRVLKRSEVEKKAIPQAYIEPGALRDWPLKPPKTRIALQAGEQLTQSKLIDESLLMGLSWKLKNGQVAMAVQLPAEQSVGTFIEPGDFVSVVGIDQNMSVLLKSVAVLAVQRALGEEVLNSSTLFTLAVGLEQAPLLARAREKGPLHLVLLPAFSTGGNLE